VRGIFGRLFAAPTALSSFLRPAPSSGRYGTRSVRSPPGTWNTFDAFRGPLVFEKTTPFSIETPDDIDIYMCVCVNLPRTNSRNELINIPTLHKISNFVRWPFDRSLHLEETRRNLRTILKAPFYVDNINLYQTRPIYRQHTRPHTQ